MLSIAHNRTMAIVTNMWDINLVGLIASRAIIVNLRREFGFLQEGTIERSVPRLRSLLVVPEIVRCLILHVTQIAVT